MEWGTPLEAMEAALELEKTVNQSLLDLHKAAGSQGDAHLCDFLEAEYLTEQVEGIKEIGDMITKIKRAPPRSHKDEHRPGFQLLYGGQAGFDSQFSPTPMPPPWPPKESPTPCCLAWQYLGRQLFLHAWLGRSSASFHAHVLHLSSSGRKKRIH